MKNAFFVSHNDDDVENGGKKTKYHPLINLLLLKYCDEHLKPSKVFEMTSIIKMLVVCKKNRNKNTFDVKHWIIIKRQHGNFFLHDKMNLGRSFSNTTVWL